MKYLYILCFILCINLSMAQKRPSLIPYRKGDHWGYCDTTKKVIIPIIYERAFPFVEGKAIVKTTSSKVLWIDEKGKTIKEFPYKMGEYLPNMNMVMVHNLSYNRSGLLHINGRLVLPLVFNKMEVLGTDSFEVVQNGKKGVINSKGDTLKKFVSYQEDLIRMAMASSFPSSNCKSPCVFAAFSEQMAVTAQMNLFGYMDSTLTVVIPCKYKMAESFSHGLARVMFDNGIEEKPVKYENGVPIYSAKDLEIYEGYIDKMGVEYWEK